MKWVVSLEDEYLLRRDNMSKVVLEEVLDLDTNATLLDDNSAPKIFQVYIEALCRFGTETTRLICETYCDG